MQPEEEAEFHGFTKGTQEAEMVKCWVQLEECVRPSKRNACLNRASSRVLSEIPLILCASASRTNESRAERRVAGASPRPLPPRSCC